MLKLYTQKSVTEKSNEIKKHSVLNNTAGSRFTTGYVLEYLVVNRIVVKRILFKWLKLR